MKGIDTTVRYCISFPIGPVSKSGITDLFKKLRVHKGQSIEILISSVGGDISSTLEFYKRIRCDFGFNLKTIACVGIGTAQALPLFLSGHKRFIMPKSTITISPDDKKNGLGIFDYQVAEIIADNSNSQLSTRKALQILKEGKVLKDTEALELGLAHGLFDPIDFLPN